MLCMRLCYSYRLQILYLDGSSWLLGLRISLIANNSFYFTYISARARSTLCSQV